MTLQEEIIQSPNGSASQPVLEPAQQSQTDNRVKFASDDVFLKVLRRRVDELFLNTHRRRRDCLEMYIKTVAIIAWFIGSYVLLVFWADAWWQAILLAISMGTSLACIGFAIQHDGAHAAYSSRNWINQLMAMTLDSIGASSYYWKKTHNIVHHTFTNITGHDGDIDLGILGRLSPHQPWRKFHRLQHMYLWVLYGFISVKWLFFDDFRSFVEQKAGAFDVPRPRGWDLAVFVGGKLLFLSWALVIPMMFHAWYLVLLFVLLAAFVEGLLLSVVFQLAHCVEEAEFPMPPAGTSEMENAWAVHQVETTVNFATRNRAISWLTGGLNHQIEHHLFPRICHVNYPAVSEVVKETCRDFGIRYSAHDTFSSALLSHYRWLRQMGNSPGDSASLAEPGI